MLAVKLLTLLRPLVKRNFSADDKNWQAKSSNLWHAAHLQRSDMISLTFGSKRLRTVLYLKSNGNFYSAHFMQKDILIILFSILHIFLCDYIYLCVTELHFSGHSGRWPTTEGHCCYNHSGQIPSLQATFGLFFCKVACKYWWVAQVFAGLLLSSSLLGFAPHMSPISLDYSRLISYLNTQ